MWLISFLLLFASAAKAADCQTYLQAFNSYDESVNGKLVEKNSIFDLTDWSVDSAFEGILLTKEAPQDAQLIFEYGLGSGQKAKRQITCDFEVWRADSQFRQAKMEPEKVLASAHAGFYRVKLLHSGQTLCEQTFRITSER